LRCPLLKRGPARAQAEERAQEIPRRLPQQREQPLLRQLPQHPPIPGRIALGRPGRARARPSSIIQTADNSKSERTKLAVTLSRLHDSCENVVRLGRPCNRRVSPSGIPNDYYGLRNGFLKADLFQNARRCQVQDNPNGGPFGQKLATFVCVSHVLRPAPGRDAEVSYKTSSAWRGRAVTSQFLSRLFG
jgi:hypothetical protein